MSDFSWFQDHGWALVEVRGEDRADFLQRLTTNVLPTSQSPLVHNFFLSVNARVQAEFWMSALDDRLALLTPVAQVEALTECIDRYHFGEKIDVVVPGGKLFVVRGERDKFDHLCRHVFTPDPRYGKDCHWCDVVEVEPFLQEMQKLGPVMDEVEAERRRINLGRLKYGVDYDQDTLFVEVAQQNDFSETKGCYPGQEIVARVLHRGRLNRHLRGFTSTEEIPAGWNLKVDGKDVATVKSRVSTPEGGSMGYLLVRREYGDAGQDLTSTVGGRDYTLTVVERAGEVLTGVEE